MTQDKLLKKMFDFQKATVDNSFKAMALMRGQGEKVLDTLVSQSPWIPDDGKKAINDWNKACTKGSDSFKEAIDNNFKKAEEFFFQAKAKAGAKAKKTA